MASVGYERRKAVANAWKAEAAQVLRGHGTRDWTEKEQREIIAKGKATGYEGHHMKSVDGHTTKAGDAENIQFLTRKEHLAAHSGNFRNNTNGYYDHVSGEIHSFGRYKAHIEARPLTKPLSEGQIRRIQRTDGAAHARGREKARLTERRSVKKTSAYAPTESKTLARQRRGELASGADAFETESKTLARQRSGELASGSATAETESKTLARQRRGEIAAVELPHGTSHRKGRSHS